MKLQLIKEVSYAGTEISWNIWTTKADGAKISCLECHSDEDAAKKAFEKRVLQMKEIPQDFKPEILREVDL